MKSKPSIIILLSAFATIGISCNKQLEISNPNAQLVDAFWTTKDNALKGVTAAYTQLVKPGAMARWIFFDLDLRSDEGTSNSPWIDLQNWQKFIMPDYNFAPCSQSVWQDHYQGIYRCNQAITNIPKIEMDANLKKRLIGEAKFLRAFYYYNLVILWGNVPIILEPNQVTAEVKYTTETQVWAQIQVDLNDAIAALPESYDNTLNNEIGRPTKGSAYGLLGKSLLQQKKYDEAKTALDWLVTGPGASRYGLVPNYADNFKHTTENNLESVFEIQFSDKIAGPPTEEEDFSDRSIGNNRAQFFAPPGVGWSDGQATRWLVHEFLKEKTADNKRDPRLPVTVLYDSTDERGGDFTIVYNKGTFNQFIVPERRTQCWFHKYQNDYWRDFENYYSPINIRVIRYADVLLMYAECLNATGKTADAYQYVDKVRQRSKMARLTDAKPGLNQQQFLDQLKHERIVELASEEVRFADLKRWGDLGPQLSANDPDFANFVKGKNELLPIPQHELDINPNLKQNPNY
ncbi:MAG: RagB/SusD family nutrient uptake outer membrane protein [Bacteroidetes bacterium]|nr:RagB/SusD family nutrient uptake outer membrane protein [Bacteroidota bacterium]